MTAQHSVEPRLTRRVVLGGSTLAVVGLVGGCRSTGDRPSSTASPTGVVQPDESATPITTGPADEALDAVTATRTLVEATADLHLGLRPSAALMSSLHLAHEELLRGLSAATESAPAEPSARPTVSRRRAERTIRAAESGLATTLADLALSAEDGPLARALASMSAGTAQTATSAGWPGDSVTTFALPDSVTLNADETLAVQDVLAREHASLWWYGALGGRTSATQQPGLIALLTTGYDAHRQQRDQLTALLVNQGVSPVAAEPTYPIEWNLRSRSRNVEEAHRIEHDSAAAYSWLVSQTEGDLRRWASDALTNAAIRDLAVQGTPENFPGADELADH